MLNRFFPLFLILPLSATMDVKSALEHQGIDLNGSFVYHLDGNLAGGLKKGVTNQWLFNLSLRFHSEPLFDVQGGEFFFNFQAHQGPNPSYVLTGDNLFYDGISALDFVQLSEYWLQQQFGPFRIKMGRIDAITDLAKTYAAMNLMNNSFEAMPTLFGFSTYPSPAPGILVCCRLSEQFDLKGGVFNGLEAPTGYQTVYPFGEYFHYFQNLFFQMELEGRFFEERLRTLIGATYNQAPYALYVKNSRAIGYSLYGIMEAQIYEKIASFLQGAIADPYRTFFPYYVGWGLKWDQPFFQEIENLFCLGVAIGFYSPQSREALQLKREEIALEVTYRIVYHKIGIQPDLQYIINPASNNISNALGFILAFDISI